MEWDLNGTAGAAQLGLSPAQWASGRPTLTRENDVALLVWGFCQGWNPAVLPLAVAYYQVEDVDLLIEQLLLIRAATERKERAAQGAR